MKLQFTSVYTYRGRQDYRSLTMQTVLEGRSELECQWERHVDWHTSCLSAVTQRHQLYLSIYL